MYFFDCNTGETLFKLTAHTRARKVALEYFNDGREFSVPMRRERKCWTARLALPQGWFLYRFRLDG